MHNGVFTPEDFGKLVKQFLQDVGFKDCDFQQFHHLQARADTQKVADIKTHISNKNCPQELKKFALNTVEYANVFYPHMKADLIAHICVTWTIIYVIEDGTSDARLMEAVKHFNRRMLSGEPQGHPLLVILAQTLSGFSLYYGPFTSMMITTSLTRWFAAHVIEQKFETEKKTALKGALSFPAYFRQLTFGNDVTAYYIFPEYTFPEDEYLHIILSIAPELGQYRAYFNDIMSFYRETMTGDENLNYISNIANTRGISIKEAFTITCQEAVEKLKVVQTVLADHPKILEVLKTHLFNFYIWFLNRPRYKLAEIPVLAEMMANSNGTITIPFNGKVNFARFLTTEK